MSADAFGVRLYELRSHAGLTQKQLAELAGLSQAVIANLEQGRHQPTLATAAALAKALGVSTEDFLQPPTTKAKRGRGRPPKATRPAPKETKKPQGRRRRPPREG